MQDETKLYIVATPIGNLEDITLRALTVLKYVDLIAAEDTRQSRKLLQFYGINTPLFAFHAHNEKVATDRMLERLNNNQNIAYVTDAGTPLISDPGAYLVSMVRKAGYKVVPIPGPCAAIAALSVAGLQSPKFFFEGFLPNKRSARQKRLLQLKGLRQTLIFYESPHRILATLEDMVEIFADCDAVLARELTKKFETVKSGRLAEIRQFVESDAQQQLGEFVILIAGNEEDEDLPEEKIITTLKILLKEVSIKQAVVIASQLLGVSKNEVYSIAIKIKE